MIGRREVRTWAGCKQIIQDWKGAFWKGLQYKIGISAMWSFKWKKMGSSLRRTFWLIGPEEALESTTGTAATGRGGCIRGRPALQVRMTICCQLIRSESITPMIHFMSFEQIARRFMIPIREVRCRIIKMSNSKFWQIYRWTQMLIVVPAFFIISAASWWVIVEQERPLIFVKISPRRSSLPTATWSHDHERQYGFLNIPHLIE